MISRALRFATPWRGVMNIQRYTGARVNYGTLPNDCGVVVCGGGVIGCSVAYHLAEIGCNDVVLLEQGRYSMCVHVFYCSNSMMQ